MAITILDENDKKELEEKIDEAAKSAGTDGGHYTPSVVDNGDGTITISFTASKDGMATVNPVTIALPVPADGEDGQDGQDGNDGENGGYYTPSVETVTENSFKISFTASKEGMPSVGDVTITLPTAKDGEDGVGIESIVQTTTSTADGGENVMTITLTNGNKSTFTVKNGSPGSDGTDGNDGVGIKSIAKTSTSGLVDTYTITLTNNSTATFTVTNGKDGDPYTLTDTDKSAIVSDATESLKSEGSGVVLYTTQTLTEAQKAQARANIGATAGEDVEYAESVEWLEANGDTSKKYSLPDGYVYAYMEKTVEVTHNANDGSCSVDARPSANATVDTQLTDKNGCLTTAPIALDKSKSDFTVSLSGLDKLYLNYYAACYVYYFDASGEWLGYINPGNATAGLGATLDSDNNLPLPSTFDVSKGTYFASATQIRIMMGITANTSISADDYASLVINCAWLNSTEEVWGWYSTGVQHSNDKATQQNSADIAYLKENVAAIEEDATAHREETDKIPRPSGAVWYALGDSITKGEGWGGVTADTCWYAHVLKYNGYDPEKSKKIAYSGLGFAKADPNYSKTARTLVDENDFSAVDLVTIAIGINDWKETHSLDTVKSEMGYCFEKIIGDNPCCKIFFITPMNIRIGSKSTNWAFGYSSGTGGNLGQFVEAQISVCKDYGIQVVDMTYGSVVNRENIETILADAYHPTPAGHLAMARELARKITFA